MSNVEQWEHDEQRAMDNEIISLREQVEKWKSLHESLTNLNEAQERRHEKQVEKMTKERDEYKHEAHCCNIEYGDVHDSYTQVSEELAALAEQVDKLTKERDEYKSGFEAAASKYRNLKSQMREIINVC